MVDPPQMPSIKASQIAPMIVMLGLAKYDLREMGYTVFVELGFLVAQMICFGMLLFVYTRIQKLTDDGRKISIPAVVQMGQTITEAKEQTAKEYDVAQWGERVKQLFISCLIIGLVYYKWGYLMALLLQMLMTPIQLFEHPLLQVHILGKKLDRPYPQPSLFGLPSMPKHQPRKSAEAKGKKDSGKKSKKNS